eukprot:5669731-Pleurochrysis_carterae.AAC.2
MSTTRTQPSSLYSERLSLASDCEGGSNLHSAQRSGHRLREPLESTTNVDLNLDAREQCGNVAWQIKHA